MVAYHIVALAARRSGTRKYILVRPVLAYHIEIRRREPVELISEIARYSNSLQEYLRQDHCRAEIYRDAVLER